MIAHADRYGTAENVMAFLTPRKSRRTAAIGEQTIRAKTVSIGKYAVSSNVIGIDDEFDIR